MLKKGFSSVVLISGVALVVVIITVAALFKKDFSPETVTSNPSKTTTTDNKVTDTSSWKEMTSNDGTYSLKYPSTWTVQSSSYNFPEMVGLLAPDKSVIRVEIRDVNVQTLAEFVAESDATSKTAYEGTPSKTIISENEVIVGGQKALRRREKLNAAGFETWATYVLSGKKIYIFSIIPSDYRGSLNDEAAKAYDDVLSTIKFTNPTSTTIDKPANFVVTRPPHWNDTDIISVDIQTCLPSNWKSDPKQPSRIYLDRDPSYQPTVATLGRLPYYNGSRRQEYLKQKTQYEKSAEELTNSAVVKEIVVNNRSVLDISIHSFPQALVFASHGNLIEVQLGVWNMISDSEAAFRHDIYTMISCIK